MEQNQTTVKNRGPIRWGAVVPFSIFFVVFFVGGHFFLDREIRSLLQWGLTQGLGAQVDVGSVETSFWNAHLRIADIQITDAEKPQKNSLSIGEIRFGMLWDALLRARIVVNEAVIQQLEFGKARRSPGWVRPPAPPQPKDDKPSKLATEANALKAEAIKKVQAENNDNVFGDIASVLGGKSSADQIDQLKGSLVSKKMAEELDAKIKAKQTDWANRLKTLPQGEEFQKLGDRLKAVKTKDFKSPQELQQSLQQLDGIFKESDQKLKSVQKAGDDLNGDIAQINTDVKALEAQIKDDVKTLEKHFHIPQIDAKALTAALFHHYADQYIQKYETYHALAEKYVPANLLKKGTSEPDPSMQPRPRAKGVSYEFGRKNSYPLFWIKHTAISSQAGANPEAGNLNGEINDISSNQLLTGKPTVAKLDGDFPGMGINGLSTELLIDNRGAESSISWDLTIKTYPLEGKELTNSTDVKVAFKKALGSLKIKSTLKGLKTLDLNLDNQYSSIEYDVASQNLILDGLLKKIFAGIPAVTVEGKLSGSLPGIDVNLQSNLGPELQKGFEKEVSAKVAETRAKIEKTVNEEVGKNKAQIDSEVAKLRAQVEGPLKKLQAQGDSEKKQVESQTDKAKKDTENSAKKNLEKAADDLKKKLGF